MLARTDSLMSWAETGKIARVHRSPLRPVVTRRVPGSTAKAGFGFILEFDVGG